jgi:hypothetical protein
LDVDASIPPRVLRPIPPPLARDAIATCVPRGVWNPPRGVCCGGVGVVVVVRPEIRSSVSPSFARSSVRAPRGVVAAPPKMSGGDPPCGDNATIALWSNGLTGDTSSASSASSSSSRRVDASPIKSLLGDTRLEDVPIFRQFALHRATLRDHALDVARLTRTYTRRTSVPCARIRPRHPDDDALASFATARSTLSFPFPPGDADTGSFTRFFPPPTSHAVHPPRRRVCPPSSSRSRDGGSDEPASASTAIAPLTTETRPRWGGTSVNGKVKLGS